MSNMRQWEYIWETDTGGFSIKIEGVKYPGGYVEYLNEKGKEGWELVSYSTAQNCFIFKRQKS